jgi:hypothetical protein
MQADTTKFGFNIRLLRGPPPSHGPLTRSRQYRPRPRPSGLRTADEIVTIAIPIVMERMHPGPFYESLFNCPAASGGYLLDADAQIVSRRQFVSN